jgi:hypothetical protein
MSKAMRQRRNEAEECILVCLSPQQPPAERGKLKLRTNLQNKGLISADRGTKATLTLTIPRSLFKSYAKDLSFPIFELVFQHRPAEPVVDRRCRYNIMILDPPEDEPILTHDNIGESYVSPLSSMDSGLEAFSRNPAHGGFAALTFQSTAVLIM